MAKAKSDPTPTQLAILDLRQKKEVEHKAHANNPTHTTKKKIDEIDAQLKAAIATDNRERFVRVGGGRVKKARSAIRQIAGVAQPRSYNYTEADVSKTETTLNAEVKKACDAMRAALVRGGPVKDEDDFTF